MIIKIATLSGFTFPIGSWNGTRLLQASFEVCPPDTDTQCQVQGVNRPAANSGVLERSIER